MTTTKVTLQPAIDAVQRMPACKGKQIAQRIVTGWHEAGTTPPNEIRSRRGTIRFYWTVQAKRGRPLSRKVVTVDRSGAAMEAIYRNQTLIHYGAYSGPLDGTPEAETLDREMDDAIAAHPAN